MVVIPERFIPSVISPVMSHAKIKVSMVPIHLQDKDLATCLFDILSFLNKSIVSPYKNFYTTTQTHGFLYLR